jgi:hypothetical protein
MPLKTEINLNSNINLIKNIFETQKQTCSKTTCITSTSNELSSLN